MIKVTKYLQLATFAMVKVSSKHFVLRVTFIRLMSQYYFLKSPFTLRKQENCFFHKWCKNSIRTIQLSSLPLW